MVNWHPNTANARRGTWPKSTGIRFIYVIEHILPKRDSKSTWHPLMTDINAINAVSDASSIKSYDQLNLHLHQYVGKMFNRQTSLKKHIRSDCGTFPEHKCAICENAFHTVDALRKHNMEHEQQTNNVSSSCGKRLY